MSLFSAQFRFFLPIAVCVLLAAFVLPGNLLANNFAKLEPLKSKEGYVSRLLINEVPFPGESGYVSVENTKAAMVQILWVLEGRLRNIPPGYRQRDVAAISSEDVIDLITVGGVHGQCEGFFRDSSGSPDVVDRVEERVQYLLSIANSGGRPGKFAGLVNFAIGLAENYIDGGIDAADRFAGIHEIGRLEVTGGGYSWMTDRDYYNPGGNFLKIPNSLDGALGNNRFFTLRKLK